MKIWTTESPLFPESWKYWKLKSPTFSIIPREMLEIDFFQLSHILEILEIGFFNFLISWKYWKSDSSIFSYPGNTGGGRAQAGGRLQGLCCAALDYFWNMFPGISGYPGNIGNMFFSIFWDFSKKDARRNFTQDAPTDEPRSLI